VSTGRVVAVDLPHYLHHHHLELLAEKSGLGGLEDRREGGCGSSSSVSSEE